MKYELVIQKEAIGDINSAFEWYEEQRIDLGKELIAEIEQCIHEISLHPERYGFVRGSQHFRRKQLNRFPYIVVFEFDNKKVTINSVAHNKQNRKYD